MSKLWPLFAILFAAWIYLFATQFVYAHEWYSSASDPVFNSNCCGGHDCAPVDPAWVSEVQGGYQLTMTLDETRTVNPGSRAPISAFIPINRVQSPPKAEHTYYACIYSADRKAPREGVICFDAAPTM
jgi:hypothetical protein